MKVVDLLCCLWQDAEQTSLVQFKTLFLTCKMLLDTSFFFSSSSLKSGKSLQPNHVTRPGCGSRKPAQYCETGGAVDSM